MSEARLRQELAESKAELDIMRYQVSSGMHTVHKDLFQNGRVRRTPPHLRNFWQASAGQH